MKIEATEKPLESCNLFPFSLTNTNSQDHCKTKLFVCVVATARLKSIPRLSDPPSKEGEHQQAQRKQEVAAREYDSLTGH